MSQEAVSAAAKPKSSADRLQPKSSRRGTKDPARTRLATRLNALIDGDKVLDRKLSVSVRRGTISQDAALTAARWVDKEVSPKARP